MTDIDYKGYHVSLAKYGSNRKYVHKKAPLNGKCVEVTENFWFVTDLPVSRRNVQNLVERGRMCWKIEK